MQHIVMDNSESAADVQFKQQLLDLCVLGAKTILLKKDEYLSLIEELKNAVEVKSETPRQYYILKK